MFNQIKRRFRKVFSQPEPNNHQLNFDALREILGYEFVNQDFLIQALKHRSFLSISQENRIHSNERLELLGDSVLGLVVVDFLYHKFPGKEEGELTSMKSLVVSRRILAKIAKAMGLGAFILLSESEEKSGGRKRASINSDAIEAIIGAIYLDGGLEKASEFVRSKILCSFEDVISEELHTNFKSMLLEYSQSQNLGVPLYDVQSVEGPDHEKRFTIQVKIQDNMLGLGTAPNKKRAEQLAARQALKKLYLI
jgi:ribonuclease-3